MYNINRTQNIENIKDIFVKGNEVVGSSGMVIFYTKFGHKISVNFEPGPNFEEIQIKNKDNIELTKEEILEFNKYSSRETIINHAMELIKVFRTTYDMICFYKNNFKK